MHTLQATAASSLSLPAESYIYSIAKSAPGSFAAISSDDSLRVFDAANLDQVTVVSAKTHEAGVTSLRSYATGDSQLLVTGGREGKVKLWDVRAKKAIMEMETARHAPVLSVACNPENNIIVSGTELLSSQAVVAFWDIRSPQTPGLQYVESHNDDITELQYHPTRSNILLSGSTDGLVNVYDTTIADEDDALVQVINHGSVHHAGFVSERTIYALSHDEQFSIHPATDPDDPAQDPEPVHFDDVREPLGCEYVVQLCVGTQGPYLAAGNKANKQLDLIPLVSTPNWRFDMDNLWRLPGAHGEEVVRSVYLDEQSQAVFTCGEDGFVRAWRPVDGASQDVQGPASSAKVQRPKEKKQKDRFKPY
ncbi:Uncharacterized protein PECH_005641 [Penicillium ucsense]|uniref:Anaphase-promoting complex subunit 4 WD40 domain-containing protein n=1 Tax=Penicillium ucsense TaxID=2839758 RepID=A0A8J8W826_9EURO|nr:Uncharacterized protein PECM_002857 [Penicillium ucsense]KAF7739230.1 Uncharacterized protein PECH_005641 [Penicillium ucsense]